MIYQLEVFDKWIRKDIHPETLKSIPENELRQYADFAISEKESICNYFRDKAIGKPPVPTTKFIQAHQVGVATLTSVIVDYTKSGRYEFTSVQQSFYFQICLLLNEIIEFIRQHLPEYFDLSLPITYTQAELARSELNQQLQQLMELEQNPILDRVLFRMTTLFVRQFLGEEKQVSYLELTYFKELVSRLRGLLDLDNTANFTYEIHLILFQLNFNFPRYVLYYTYWLDSQLSAIPERAKRLDELSRHLHAIEQIRTKPGFTLFPDLPPLAEQLLTSIKTTYQYLLAEDKPVNHSIVEQISIKSSGHLPKIQLSISVPLLALFLKLFIKAGIIINENKADVFRIIADNFTTLKSEKISYDSLRGKYTNTPPVAFQQLRDILNKMLELLKQF
jgi:hypothetical protein